MGQLAPILARRLHDVPDKVPKFTEPELGLEKQQRSGRNVGLEISKSRLNLRFCYFMSMAISPVSSCPQMQPMDSEESELKALSPVPGKLSMNKVFFHLILFNRCM